MPQAARLVLPLLLLGGLLALPACWSEPAPEVRLRLVNGPQAANETSGRWAYVLEVARPALARVALVDVRQPDDGIELELAIDPGAPAQLSFRLPRSLGSWSSADEKPALDYELQLDQGDQHARTAGDLASSWLPERCVGAPGPVSHKSNLPDGTIGCELDAPVVLVAWAYAANQPQGAGGLGFLSPGVQGGAGDPFSVPETLLHGEPIPLAEYEGALWQLRLRVEPR